MRMHYSFAIFTVLKAGFVWSGKAGSGIVIARLEDGTWSAPSCIATGGVGFGLLIGEPYRLFSTRLSTMRDRSSLPSFFSNQVPIFPKYVIHV